MRTDQIDRLVYDISSRFDSAITPSEARALIPTPDADRSVDWLSDVLSDIGIGNETIEDISSLAMDRFHDVGLYCVDETVFVFYFDPLRHVVYFRDLDTGLVSTAEEFLAAPPELASNGKNPLVIRYFEVAEESLAAIPGVETHWFFSPLWKFRGYFVQAGIASLLTNLFAVGTSLFAMVVYNRIIPSNALSSLLVLVVGMAILLIADYLVKTVRSKLLGAAGVEADLIIADRLFTQVLDIQYKSRNGSVGQMANVLKEYEQIREFFTSAALVSVIDLPFALIFVGFIWFLGGIMVIPVVAGILFLFAITWYMQPRMKKIAERSLEDAHNKHSVLVETLSGLETVKLLGAGGILRRRFKTVLARQSSIAEESKRQSFFSSNLTQEIQQGVQIAVVAIGAIAVSDGEFGFGAIIACTILSGKALLPFAQLAQLLSRFNQIVSGYKALDELMKQPVEHENKKQFIKRGRYKGAIRFENVSFSYPNSPQAALKDVSLEIAPGDRVAIVGRVGSGKTTIGKMITKLFVPDDGAIFIDGADIRQIDPAEIRENIGLVSQEPWMIAGSVEQNVVLGAPNAGTDEMLWASELAGVSDFVNRHPDGFKMMVAERGEGLSGGQRQAISIARALVRKPPILLFDEPTSSMDARSERNLIARLKETQLNCTVIVITHRTSLLALVDRVIVIDDGKIVGSGSVDAFLNATLSKTGNANKLETADDSVNV
ncbi:MAG: type I secretion system permease/ATPase [Gammaproteobacteria bacterium]|nr:type I secretion system permease/ATPase [Gammaproteobacteria bacterium]OUX77957.1 MAG: hypothetical protein CBC19_05830 [Oceanospirillales bacterium TMED59]